MKSSTQTHQWVRTKPRKKPVCLFFGQDSSYIYYSDIFNQDEIVLKSTDRGRVFTQLKYIGLMESQAEM